MYYKQLEDLKAETEYDEKSDVQFLKDADGFLEFLFKAGDFAIFFPPGCTQTVHESGWQGKCKEIGI